MTEVAETQPEETASVEPQSADENEKSLFDDVVKELDLPKVESEDVVEKPVEETKQTEAEVDEGETNTAEADDTKDHDSGRLDAKTQATLDKRIGKEVAKRKELELQLENERAYARELVKKAEEAEPSEPEQFVPVNPDNAYDGLNAKQLKEKEKEAKKFILWAENGPLDEGYYPESDEESDYSPEEIKAEYSRQREALLLKIPEARERGASTTKVLNQVAASFEELQDDKSEAFQKFAGIWNDPSFKSFRLNNPNAAWVAAWAVRGMTSAKSIPAARKKTATAPKVPMSNSPAAPAPIGSVARPSAVLTEEDLLRAGNGQVEDAVAKLLS